MANKFDHLTATERVGAPSTPATGDWAVYFKSDGFYVIDDTGTEFGPFGDAASAVSDTAYGSGWDAETTTAPSKNAVYDALNTNGKGFVNHGSTAGTARPAGFASVEWYGTVEPTNAVAGDTWVDPT